MRPAITRAREVALTLLQPSTRELERGLRLHGESPVVEAYSLGLHAPQDACAINAALEAGASEAELQDLKEEQIMLRWAEDEALRQEYQDAWEAAGVTCFFLNAGEEGNQPLRLLKRLARYTALTDAMPGFLRRIASVEDILAAHRAGEHGICLGLNGVPLAGTHVSIEEELAYLRVFAQLGARMMHLTYNRQNPIGSGCGETADAGLTDFGRAAVREMNRLGIVIDLAHTGWQTSLDAARCSAQPVVISHAAAHSLHPHIRCKSDAVIRAVVEGGGLIGVTNIPAFLGGRGDITAFLDHIDYLVKTFGADAVAIGTDRPYVAEGAAAANAALHPRAPRRSKWESLWPPPGHGVNAPEWSQPSQLQSLAWTNWPLFTVGLAQRGHSDETIGKIIGGNLLRVARQTWHSYSNPQTPPYG